MTRLSAVALVAALAACGRGGAGDAQPVQRLERLELSQSHGRVPGWTLAAESAVLEESDREARLVEPRMEIYKKGRPATKLSARSGSVRTDSNDVKLSTGVLVLSLLDGARLETEELLYSSAKRKLYTERDVVITRKDGIVRGQGLEATPDLSEVTIFKQRTRIKEGG